MRGAVSLGVSFGLAAGITLGLFTMMQTLIEMTEMKLTDYDERKVIDFVRLRRDSRTEVKKRELPQKVAPKKPPPSPSMDMPSAAGPGAAAIRVSSPKVDTRLNLKGGLKLGPAPSDSDAVPAVRVEPMYPRHLQQRGIEGYVVVQFDVAPSGSVENARVIDASPAGIFDKAALRAVAKWRYKPKIVDGKPVARRNFKTRFNFEQKE